jgi:tetratricopeptide (TPR) repeat protein
VFSANRRYADAIRVAEELRRASPESYDLHLQVAYCMILLGRFGEAEQSLRGADIGGRLFGESLLLARQRKGPETEARIDAIRRLFGDAASYQYAQAYAQLEDKDRAFAALDRAWQIRDSGLLWMKVDAMLDPVRDDPRFNAIFGRLDFPT